MILTGHCLDLLRSLDDESVQCVVTSPPYWGLRDYGIPGSDWPSVEGWTLIPGTGRIDTPAWHGCLGLEPEPLMFIAHLMLVFREVRRVLKRDGVAWMNLGDSYASGFRTGGDQGADGVMADRSITKARKGRGGHLTSPKHASDGAVPFVGPNRFALDGLKQKDLVGIPWMAAFALRSDGWFLRQDVVWSKPNPMPESVRDRCTKAHEYVFQLTKSERYYFDQDAIKEPVSGTANPRGSGVNPKAAKWKTPDGWDTSTGTGGHGAFHRDGREKGRTRPKQNESFAAAVAGLVERRNLRSVWTIGTEPYKEAHFATFPTEIPRRCILSSTRPGDVVLDPFGGSGTTGAVALELGREFILLEINPAYASLAETRTNTVTPGLPLV